MREYWILPAFYASLQPLADEGCGIMGQACHALVAPLVQSVV